MQSTSRHINEVLSIAPDDALNLWLSASYCPQRDAHNRLNIDLSRSENGEWALKLRSMGALVRDAHRGIQPTEFVHAGHREFARVQSLGIIVISYAAAPVRVNDDNALILVTPWIPDMLPCPEDTFHTDILPRVTEYEKQAREHSDFYLNDLYRRSQYSVTAGQEKPFLHDVDMYI